MELKQLTQEMIEAGKFEANGKKFVIEPELSFNRFAKMKEFLIEFGYSKDFDSLFSEMKKTWELLDGSHFAHACTTLWNCMEGALNIKGKFDISFKICALFCNYIDEDKTVYDEAIEKNKIEDWAKEYAVTGFFLLANSLLTSSSPVYQNVFQSILEKGTKKKK